MGNIAFAIEIVPQHGQSRHISLIKLNRLRLVVGRSPRHSDIVLNDARVSRVHLRLDASSGTTLLLTDLYSANGTLLEHNTLVPNTPTPWQIGQVVTIGDTRLFLWEDDPGGDETPLTLP